MYVRVCTKNIMDQETNILLYENTIDIETRGVIV